MDIFNEFDLLEPAQRRSQLSWFNELEQYKQGFQNCLLRGVRKSDIHTACRNKEIFVPYKVLSDYLVHLEKDLTICGNSVKEHWDHIRELKRERDGIKSKKTLAEVFEEKKRNATNRTFRVAEDDL